MRTSAIVIQDIASGASAQIRPDVGFNCFSFKARIGGRPVEAFWSEPSFADGEGRPSRSGMPILFPFGGRIQNGVYEFNGQTYTIKHGGENGPNAIHGFVFTRRWRVTDLASNRVVGEFQGSIDAPETLSDWPSDYRIQIAYTVSGSTLTTDITVSNPGRSTLPFVFGLHPYFRVPLGRGDATQTNVVVPADEYWELENMLPTGELIPVDSSRDLREGQLFPDISIDAVLTGLTATGDTIIAVIEDRGSGVRLIEEFPGDYRFCIVYTAPNRQSIAIEPYTGAPDPFHAAELGLDPNVILLEPGKSWKSSVTIRLEAIS